MKHILQV